MLNNPDRSRKIYILTLDRILGVDVLQRLGDMDELKDIEIIMPAVQRDNITTDDIEEAALDTKDSQMIIMDVRSNTLPRLQSVYNKISGYNRSDFNQYCHSVLIGDGPPKLYNPGTGIDVFVQQLAKLRIDYSPALFFFDPLLYYTFDEKQAMNLDANSIPQQIPERLKSSFKGEDVSIESIRSYFRAAKASAKVKNEKKKKRLKALGNLYYKRFKKEFGEKAGQTKNAFQKNGLHFPAEALRLNIYPFSFEKWIVELMDQTKATCRKVV